MESEESAIRSCPLCQLTFPTGYPDDALIKHIDSHLENSKIWPFFFSFFFLKKTLYTLFSTWHSHQADFIPFCWVFFSNPAVVWWVCMIILKNFPGPTTGFLILTSTTVLRIATLFQFASHILRRDLFCIFRQQTGGGEAQLKRGHELEWTHVFSVRCTRSFHVLVLSGLTAPVCLTLVCA